MRMTLIAATDALLSFSDFAFAGDLNRLLSVKGMTRPACSAKVEHALTEVQGVKATQVDLETGQARVVADERVKPTQLVNAVQKTGFPAETVKPGAVSRAHDPCCQ